MESERTGICIKTGAGFHYSFISKILIMKAEDILHAHDLDILFEGRHKAYGAYDLRKYYHLRVRLALLSVFLLSLFVSLIGYFWKPEQKTRPVLWDHGMVHIAKEIEAEKKPDIKKPDKPKATQNIKTQAYPSRIVVVPNQVPTSRIQALSDSVAIDSRPNDNPTTSTPLVGLPPGPGKPINGVPEPPQFQDPGQPLDVAEVMPEFPGGIPALRRFLESNLETPSSVESGETVSVKMRFIVGFDGKLHGFETVQGGGEDCNQEVLRVLKKMPAWVPGKSNGNKVSVYYILPVSFARAD